MITAAVVVLPAVAGALAAFGAFWVVYRVGYPMMSRVIHSNA